MPDGQVRNGAAPGPYDATLNRSVRFVVRKLKHRGVCGIERIRLAGLARVSTPEFRNAYCAERRNRQPEPGLCCIRPDVVTNVVIGATEPECRPITSRIWQGTAVAVTLNPVAGPSRAQRKIVIERVEAFAAVLCDDAGAPCVIDNVVLNESVMAAVDCNPPLLRAFDS